MAPVELPHTFRKLRLDTKTTNRPPKSAFASIRRDDHATNEPSAEPAGNLDASTTADFNHAAPRYHNKDMGSWADGDLGHGDGEFLRKRKTSISFDAKVTVDSGSQHDLEAPLPKPWHTQKTAKVEAPLDAEEGSMDGSIHSFQRERAVSESARSHYDPETGGLLDDGKPVHRPIYQTGESRHPLLQTTVDELARGEAVPTQDRVASLTSDATASPPLEELSTPADVSMGDQSYLLSPVPIASPMDFPASHSATFPISRPSSSLSQRSRSYRSEKSAFGSVRKGSRRGTVRSNSSMSPAAAFLSNWGKEEAAAVTEPDDEGQEIGDRSGYFIGRQIGYGGFSVVKEVSTMEEGQKIVRAVKIVRKQVDGKGEYENERVQAEFEREVEIWRFLKQRYILPLIAVYDTPFATFCITKLNKGGTLFDLVRSTRKSGSRGLPARLAKRYSYQVASAIRYLHEDVRVVHRDIKLENCLVDMSDPKASTEGGDILLCDFGMADFITNEHRHVPEPYDNGPRNIGPSETSCVVAGSLPYAAPELLTSRGPLYCPAVDIWSFGCLVYALITGALPFEHGFNPTLTMMILKGEYDVNALRKAPAAKESSGDDIVELIQGCLAMDVERRWCIADVLDCRWLEGCRELFEDVDGAWS
ncbi:CAMK protein kinase [Coniosporium apollinis CBS 100218]|uniref:CAMK protein kinase n=1 Tax=Coniosporium apollinis (strain CBS 100218) TaxID=1168221 RepID=R7Z6Y2_CONA1|nr:CAMK protein kinase [Coniosporium apollinis CBS 100218]EON69868.1 CAMK protein kinase [Coniosporium apollinis CBS 100218]